ncbi:MAG: GHMP kinase [Armatimonadetes bacterium]|nr:GHMP kinase [Armatimonadota bacterium]NIM24650.1 GHMP kinase [Armatimonadota bacterium]NIM68529.1 GHMP kinase [Armatimonadota bacterium]NIM76911.1 GHMP kinase [Armatimonadota bacterium]NIN06723.1 GHMP kinase [Armatimonadota bacterium]
MIISRTPLRISFAGGGTDFADFYLQHEGAVVSTAIDHYVYVVVKHRFDKKIRVAYTRTEMVDHPDELAHDLVRESLKRAGIDQGIEICTMADVPSQGSGLGSSSSLTVGLLNAFYAYTSKPHTPEILARDACEIEMDILRRPMGKQDAYIAAYGGLRMFRFLKSGAVEIETIPLSPDSRRWLKENLLLFFTGRTRQAETILCQQKKNIPQRVESLCTLRNLAWELRDCLLNGMGPDFGLLLHRGWEMKKGLADGISDAELDELYTRAISAGAVGGKILGAGGGGFMLLHCPFEHHARLRAAFRDFVELPFEPVDRCSEILLDVSNGAVGRESRLSG